MLNIGDKVKDPRKALIGRVAFVIERNGVPRYWVAFSIDEYNAWYTADELKLVEGLGCSK